MMWTVFFAYALAAVPDGQVVSIQTADGITLSADWLPAAAGAPAVLLLHMKPPENSRSSWPLSFRTLLHDDGFSVLNLDRRGAGGSGGRAEDAYVGEKGVLDARAAVQFLLDHHAGALTMIGASNGSTTALDYAVTAAANHLPVPAKLIFLSPGEYTEHQHSLSALTLPHVFVGYPGNEADFNQALAPAHPQWSFHAYPQGKHGTYLFASAPQVVADMRAFLKQ